jgi:hypothetical protein
MANVKNSSEDAEMIPAVDVDNNEDLGDESAVVSTVVTNVGTASPCVGTVTSEASFGNMHLEDFTPEKNLGTSSGFAGLTDKEILSNGQQQVRKIIYICAFCISGLVFKHLRKNFKKFKHLRCPGSKGHCSSIKEDSFWCSVWKTSCWKKAKSSPRAFK